MALGAGQNYHSTTQYVATTAGTRYKWLAAETDGLETQLGEVLLPDSPAPLEPD